MKFNEPASEASALQPPHSDQAEVAELATRLSALPHSTPHADRTANTGPPAATAEKGHARHGWLWWACHLAVWSIVFVLAAIACLRVFYHDGVYFLTWLNAFTRYVYLPAYGGLIWSAWQRRGMLALASFAVVVCHLIWMAPDFAHDRRFEPPAEAAVQAAGSSPSVRIFFANVLQHNREFDSMFEEVASADPDVLVMAEWGWAWNRAFDQSALASVYPHGASVTQPHFGMVNVFSKLPLENESQTYIDDRLVRTVDIRIGSEVLRVIALHAARPLYPDQRDYVSYWNQMFGRLAAETGAFVAIGDFNATQHSLVYARLKAAGLRSAHEVGGRGYAVTWPNDVGGVSLIRIDQAFLSPQVTCERVVEGRGMGSDHKPIIVDVRVR